MRGPQLCTPGPGGYPQVGEWVTALPCRGAAAQPQVLFTSAAVQNLLTPVHQSGLTSRSLLHALVGVLRATLPSQGLNHTARAARLFKGLCLHTWAPGDCRRLRVARPPREVEKMGRKKQGGGQEPQGRPRKYVEAPHWAHPAHSVHHRRPLRTSRLSRGVPLLPQPWHSPPEGPCPHCHLSQGARALHCHVDTLLSPRPRHWPAPTTPMARRPPPLSAADSATAASKGGRQHPGLRREKAPTPLLAALLFLSMRAAAQITGRDPRGQD
ncbi:hypothetical protein NDU88_000015 [Pleurodeles waltl]|uniref:Uncharacterized protein n=1 Tax=Pleurodeles waltl TaxID=8319 RepID=A0AAV7UPB5_PLEWA|nr:hypothetical protein NDU88_000015 [Pleurodeles waltl]